MTDPALSVSTPHGRFYAHPKSGAKVPSITNIKGMKALPALQYVAARNVAEWAVANLDVLGQLDPADAVKLAKGKAWPARDDPTSPSNIGNQVHDWIDQYIKSDSKFAPDEAELEAAPITARRMWGQFLNFVQDGVANHNLKFVDSEFSVWSYEHEYAGTADFACRWDGELVLGDTKTGKAAYPDTAMQLAALSHADVILRPDGQQYKMPKFAQHRILHIRPMGYKFIQVERIEEAWATFLGLKVAFDWEIDHADKTLVFAG